jgi:hypothetical protein
VCLQLPGTDSRFAVCQMRTRIRPFRHEQAGDNHHHGCCHKRRCGLRVSGLQCQSDAEGYEHSAGEAITRLNHRWPFQELGDWPCSSNQTYEPDQAEERVNRSQQQDIRRDGHALWDKLRQERNVEHADFGVEQVGQDSRDERFVPAATTATCFGRKLRRGWRSMLYRASDGSSSQD